ncbi:MAG: Maf-like protein, partial [SAR202 cluster bacterium]|nr:Maf-like protein [SAR202 cluster bacterium]
MLASGSPRRAEILSGAGFQLEVVPSGVDEKKLFTADTDLPRAVEHLALSKAKSVSV